jgi:hypothetical protein
MGMPQEQALYDDFLNEGGLPSAMLDFWESERFSPLAVYAQAAIRHFLNQPDLSLEMLNAYIANYYLVTGELADELILSVEEIDALLSSIDLTNGIKDFLNDYDDANADFAVSALLNAAAAGKLYGPYEEDEIEQLWLMTPAEWAEVGIFYSTARLRWENENPNESCGLPCKARLLLEAIWKVKGGQVHSLLDICGLAPVVGEGCDGLNGVLYLIEGDGLNASLSFAATIPFAGWTAKGSKWAAKVFTFKGTKWELKLTHSATTGLIGFGSKTKLRKVLQIPTGSPKEANHIIPWQYTDHPLVQKAADAKTNTYHMNHAANGKELEKFRYATNPDGTHANHPQYNQAVNGKMTQLMDALADYFGPNNIPPDIASQKLIQLQDNIGSIIDANPTIKINDLDLSGVQIPSVP